MGLRINRGNAILLSRYRKRPVTINNEQRTTMNKIYNTMINFLPEVAAVIGTIVILNLIGVIHVVS